MDGKQKLFLSWLVNIAMVQALHLQSFLMKARRHPSTIVPMCVIPKLHI